VPGTYLIAHDPADHYGLGRHVNHNPESRRYPFLRTTAAPVALSPVYHAREIPIFDQGWLGSCTGNAALGIMGTGPYYQALAQATETRYPTAAGQYPFTEEGATALYHDITANDPYDGTYPPDDTGSDGLSAAQALQRAGIIPGYEHAFGIDQALTALQKFPLLVGTVWTGSMFEPSRSGLVTVGGDVVGGHEWIVDEYVPAGIGGYDPKRDLVGGTTSWGTRFGVGGRFYLTVGSFDRLLRQDGDVIILTPPTAPAPQPEPEPDPPAPFDGDAADRMLADAFATWRAAKGL
jgi:hypothetical protein